MRYTIEKPDLIFDFIDEIDTAYHPEIPGGETWSLNDVVLHIFETEIQSYIRLMGMLAEPGIQVTGYDENKWTFIKGRSVNLPEMRRTVKLLRSQIYSVSSHYSDEELQQITGIHSVRGPVSFLKLAERYENHIDIHLKQSRRIASKLLNNHPQ